MRLRRLRAHRRAVDLPLGTGDARRRFDRHEGLVVVLEDEHGARGVGEAAPLRGLSRESLADVEGAWHRLPDEWAIEAAPTVEASAPPSLSFALETARLDLSARRAGRSFESMFGGIARPRQSTAQVLSLVEGPLEHQGEPDRPLKFKLGRPGRETVELSVLERLRLDRGPDLELRIDLNGAWSLETWLELAPRLAELGPVFVEDPLPAESWATMPASPVPLAVDEPLAFAGVDLRSRLVVRSDTAALVLKPTLLGGLRVARELSEAAARRGQPVVYSHCYEGPIAFSAIVAASLADPAASLAAGLGPHPGLGRDVTRVERLEGSTLVPATRPGLGFEEELS